MPGRSQTGRSSITGTVRAHSCGPEQIQKRGKKRNAMIEYRNFINGQFVASSGTDRISVTNPSTGATICTVPDSTQHDVDMALDAALKAQPAWAKQPASARGKVLRAIAAKIRERVEPLARVITEEQG